MANLKASKKDAIRSEKKRLHNNQVKNALKTHAKTLREAVAKGEHEKARDQFKVCQKIFQKASIKGIIHKKTASRKIGRLAQLINSSDTKDDS
ncbi:30S ribosomal protein S20 [Candidatus Riflebacteria bacterium]